MSDPVSGRLPYPGTGGHPGRRVVKLLEMRRFQYHRIQPQPADIEPRRTKVKADFNEVITLAAAFAGVERLMIN